MSSNGNPILRSALEAEGNLKSLVPRFSKDLTEKDGESLYQLLIRSLEIYLEKHQIETLVIVPMDRLYQVPFAALVEGTYRQQALASTPPVS